MAKPKKPIVPINDPKLRCALDKYESLSKAHTDIGKQKDAQKDVVATLLQGYRDEHGDDVRFKLGKLSVIITKNPGAPFISGSRLLELGVKPDIIAEATNRTPSESYRTTRETS